MDPLTLMAIASIASTVIGVMSQNKQVQAANAAQKAGQDESVANQNKLNLESIKKRKEGTVLGGSPDTGSAGAGATLLTSTSTKQSLLG